MSVIINTNYEEVIWCQLLS